MRYAALALALVGCAGRSDNAEVTCYSGNAVFYHAEHAKVFRFGREGGWHVTQPDGRELDVGGACIIRRG